MNSIFQIVPQYRLKSDAAKTILKTIYEVSLNASMEVKEAVTFLRT